MNRIPQAPKCPKCDSTNFRRWSLPHPLILHWVLNPALAFNEIVLGQRLPKTQLICKSCEGPLIDRSYVPCPSCGMMHLGRLHSGKQAFGNWRGIACPVCKEEIPCIWNIFSLLTLLLTSPFWAPPYYMYFRGKPLRPMFQVENGMSPVPKPVTKSKWIVLGAVWGGIDVAVHESTACLEWKEWCACMGCRDPWNTGLDMRRHFIWVRHVVFSGSGRREEKSAVTRGTFPVLERSINSFIRCFR